MMIKLKKELIETERVNLNRLLAGEYCKSCKSHRLSLTEDLMITCKDCCEEHSFAPILLIEYLTVCRDLLKAKSKKVTGKPLIEII